MGSPLQNIYLRIQHPLSNSNFIIFRNRHLETTRTRSACLRASRDNEVRVYEWKAQ